MTRSRIAAVLLFGAMCAAPLWPPSRGAPAPRDEYVFVPNTGRLVWISRGELDLIGRLDTDGNFLQEWQFARQATGSRPAADLINFPGLQPRAVYEFRSGRLIKGQLMPNGNFVPEAGSKVMKFEDYRYSPDDAIYIWNLPGYFKKKDDKK
jgi:hypothetical protein